MLEGVELKYGELRQALEKRGLNVNLHNTKMMVTGGEMEDVIREGRYQCKVCSHGVGPNSVLCETGKMC